MLVMMMAAQQYVFAEAVQDTGQNDYKTLYSEDFEDDTLGDVTKDTLKTDAVYAALTGASVAEEDGGNKYMKLSGGRYTYKFLAGAMAGDKLTVSFRFQQPEQADNNNLFELQETDDAKYATLMKTSGGKLIFDSTEICEVAAAAWHSVTLQYDFEEGTVDVKVDSNDSQTVEIPFGSQYYMTTEQKDKVGRFGFRSTSGDTYIDDISIESTPEHWTNQIDEIEETMALEKEYAPYVEYTDEATEEFNAVISTARADITSAETIAELNTAVSGLDDALVKYRNSGTNRALTTIFNGGTITDGGVSGWSTTKGTVTGVADDTKGFAAKLDGTSDVARLVHDTAYDGSSKNYLAKVSFMQTNKSTVEEVLSVHANGSENDSGISFTTNVFSIGTDGTNIIIKCNNSVDGHKDTTTTSWDKVSGRKIATIVSDYSVNTWYDIAVEMDADSRKLTVLVNGEPVLTDLYFIGTNTNFAKLRVGCRVNSGRGIAYFAGVGLYSDDAKDAMVSFPSDIEELSAIFAGRTGYEDVIAGTTFVETTSSGSTVTWTSENEYITQIGTDWYTTFPAGPKAEDAAAVMKATITRGSLSTTKNFELPVKAAYRGEVLNADFNVDDNTTLASLGFKKANNNDAVVSGGKAKFAASTRTLYNVSQEKRTADEEIVEFTFNQPTKGEIAQIIEINDSTGNSIGPKIVSNGTNLTVNTGDTVNATIVKNYEAGKDYKIKIVINFPERTYSVYVDGALEASAIDLEYRVRNIGRLSFANGTCTEFYIDDLKVYTNKKMSVDVSYISDGVDVTGTALNGLTSVSANVTLYNERDEATDGITAYLAVYEDGRLTAVTLAKPEWKGKDGTIALEAVTVGDGDEVKCMVWNNMMPLTSAESLKKINPVSFVDFAVDVESNREPVILQITDTQIIDAQQARTEDRLGDTAKEYWATDAMDERCFDYLRETVQNTNPDLILLTGDLVYGEFDDAGTSLSALIEVMESFEIPWAPVFGNHENESVLGADWQCEQLENAEYCLFKQRTLTGNGNYSVGITQDGVLKRVFFMLDSNGCGSMSDATVANGHSKKTPGFGENQVEWYTDTANKINRVSPGMKYSFVYHIQQEIFRTALSQYGTIDSTTVNNPINIDTSANKAETDFGYIGRDLKSPWDEDFTIYNGMKALGCDSHFVGHEHCNSASVMYDGTRFQYGQKSSCYDRANYIKEDGSIVGSYSDVGTPIEGGTVMKMSAYDGSFTDCFIYYCDTDEEM